MKTKKSEVTAAAEVDKIFKRQVKIMQELEISKIQEVLLPKMLQELETTSNNKELLVKILQEPVIERAQKLLPAEMM